MKPNLYAITFICIYFYLRSTAQNFTDSNLPIILFSTSGHNIDAEYSPTYIIWMGVIDNGIGQRNHVNDPFKYTGLIKIHTHGNSTMWLPKKAWNVTTINPAHDNLDTTLLGLPSEHDWVFKASYQDKTFLRDEVSFKIFKEMGHYASRIHYFELVVDGDYRGVYQLEEKIKHDKNRVNIAKLKPTDISGDDLTGGYIVSIDRLKPGDQGWTSLYPSNTAQDSGNTYVYDYPKPDSMPQVQKDYIHHLFDKFETVMQGSNWNNPDSGYAKYINIESFVDKFLIEELSRNTDGYRLKDFFYKNKDSKGDGRIHAGPVWDYDIAWDNCSYSGGANPYWWQYPLGYQQNFIPFWWRKLLTDDNFKNAIKCRYQLLRLTTLSKTYLYANIDSFAVYLNESQQRNFQRWPIMGQPVYPNPTPPSPDYTSEIGRLKWWISERLNWLDAYMPGTCITTGTEDPAPLAAVEVYPNPFAQDIRLFYSVYPGSSGKAKVNVELVNMVGEVVLDQTDEKDHGRYEEDIPAVRLPAGVYTLKLTVDHASVTKKIIKVD